MGQGTVPCPIGGVSVGKVNILALACRSSVRFWNEIGEKPLARGRSWPGFIRKGAVVGGDDRPARRLASHCLKLRIPVCCAS